MALPWVERADIAAIAIEDDGMHFALARLDDRGRIANWRPRSDKGEEIVWLWPETGYSHAVFRRGIENFLRGPGRRSVRAVAVSCFGLIDRRSKKLIAMPRADWNGATDEEFDFQEVIGGALEKDVAVVVEHDSTASARGEYRYRGLTRGDGRVFVYIRLGRGIGGEAFRGGNLLRPDRHMEVGHIPIVLDDKENLHKGTCHAHGQCLEGYVSDEAIRQRLDGWHGPPAVIRTSPELVEELVGRYVGQLCAVLAMTLTPHQIVLAGTRLEQHEGARTNPDVMFERIVDGFTKWTERYPNYSSEEVRHGDYIVRAMLTAADAALGATLQSAAIAATAAGKPAPEGGDVVRLPPRPEKPDA